MKKRSCLFIIVIFITATNLPAQSVSIENAQIVAENQLKLAQNINLKSASLRKLNLSYSSVTTSGLKMDTLFYVFNDSIKKGFVIVAADKRAWPILGYSLERSYSEDSQPPAYIEWMENKKEEIKFLKNSNIPADSKIIQKWKDLSSSSLISADVSDFIEPLLQTTWDQGCYYNSKCPINQYGPCDHVVTGCVATSLAQILKYWNYPENGSGSNSYSQGNYGIISADFGSTYYNWDEMPLNLTTENDAVATLMFHCGVAVNMSYGSGGSSAQMTANPLINFFKYSSDAVIKYRSRFSEDEWMDLLKFELNSKRPVWMRGGSTFSGHAFICDGFQNSDYFHFNWGWGGYQDGYYYIGNLNPYYSYNSNQAAIIKIFPISTLDSIGPINGKQVVCQEENNIKYSVDAVSNAVSYIWTLPNGVTGESTTNNIFISFGPDAESGMLKVKAINSNGESKESALNILVNNAPDAPGIIAGNEIICPGLPELYNINPVAGAIDYSWILPSGWEGYSTNNSILVTPGKNSGTISVKANNATCPSKSSQKEVKLEDFLMTNSGNYIVCGCNFYDGGGPTGNYLNNQNLIVTLFPSIPDKKLSVTFNSFKAGTNYDYLKIYNGNSITAPQIGNLTGQAGFGTITSTSDDGSLTFQFTSNGGRIFNESEAGWEAVVSMLSINSEDITMIGSGSFTTCGSNFYDGGGPDGDYMLNQNSVVTLYPLYPDSKLSVTFNSFKTGTNYDYLKIFNGNSITSPQIGNLTGQAGYGTITSTSDDGSLTFQFTSNGGRTFNESEAGWEAYISCDIVPPDDITMIGSGSFTTCESNFYDGGGQNGDYLLNQDVITTLFPTNISNRISVTFTSFTTSNNKDALYVYNGADINKELITTLSRNDNPGTISSTANDGSLTFRFISDGSNISYYNESGWEATISCICNDAIGGIATLSSSTLCIGSENQSTLTLSDFLGSSIQWQSSIDSVSWIDIEGATNSTYLISSPEISLFYRAVVLNDCSSAYSTVVKLTVLEIPIRCDIIYGPSNICKGVNSVLYSVSEILNVTSYIWELPVGATGSSTTNSIAVNFGSNAVSGILKVKGFNDCGYGAESSLLITVGSLPDNAGAISGESDVCVGSEYTYTVSSITGATSYIWELPAGASGESTTNSIIVNYGADAVSGDIKVKGHNDCGDGQESIFAVTVYSQPEAAGTISGNNIVCQGTTNTYSVLTISGATSYNWTLPAGATGASTTNSISVTFGSSAVSGDISVKGHNQCFDGEESSLSIAVNSVPEAAGIITGNENVCQGTSNVVYTVPLIPGATSYVWTLPAGAEVTTIENEIELSFGISSTSGTLKVKGCNDCGDGSESSLLITVSSLPENAGNILGESDVCLGSGYTYTVPSITGATSYFWEFPDGATGASTTNTITVNYDTNAVSGNIKVKGHNDCGEGQESTLSVTVISQPEAAGTIFGENVVCKGTSNIYTVPAISGATSYNWTLPAGATGASTTNSILVTFGNSAVSGDLFVKGHNQCFEGEESSLSITVKSVPEAASIITGDENVCQGTSNVVYSVTVIPGATSYVWTLPAGAEVITTVNEVELSFSTSSTSGTLKVTGRNDCGDGEENSLQINVFPKPDQPVITQDVDTLTSSALTGNQWYYENTIISGATNQTLVIDKSGNYYVIVTSLEECISSPSNILSAHCSWNDGIKNYQLKIYPNPTTGEINISGLPDGKKIEVSVVNMEGRLIKKQKVTSIDPTINIDNTIPGSYLFIIDGQVNQAIKIIKK